MIYNHSSLTIFFDRVENIREKLFIFENAFNDEFQKPFQLANLPDNAPTELPRIIAVNDSKPNQKIILQVAQSQLSIQWHYQVTDYSSIHKDVQTLLELAYAALRKADITQYLYSGLTLQSFLPFKDRQSVTQYLKDTFLAKPVGPDFLEINCKFTSVFDDSYYVNLSVANKVNYKPEQHIPRMIPAYMTPESFGVGIMIDINDRFGFNFQREYGSDESNSKTIAELMMKIVNEKLKSFTEDGSFSLD